LRVACLVKFVTSGKSECKCMFCFACLVHDKQRKHATYACTPLTTPHTRMPVGSPVGVFISGERNHLPQKLSAAIFCATGNTKTYIRKQIDPPTHTGWDQASAPQAASTCILASFCPGLLVTRTGFIHTYFTFAVHPPYRSTCKYHACHACNFLGHPALVAPQCRLGACEPQPR
jgi:hypothetical protein